MYGVKKGSDYAQKRPTQYQTVLTAVVASPKHFDGMDVLGQHPSVEKEENASLNATDRSAYATREAGLQRLIELVSSEAHRRAYHTRTALFLTMVPMCEDEALFPQAEYVFDNGVLSRPVTAYLEEHGRCWLSELEKSPVWQASIMHRAQHARPV